MRDFLVMLVPLAGISFFVGMQSDGSVKGRATPEPTADRHRQETTVVSRELAGSAIKSHPVLPAGILDRVDFQKIVQDESGDEISPVAQQLLQLTDDQCARVKEICAWRDAEYLEIRHRQEDKAMRIEPDAVLQSSTREPILTWEIPSSNSSSVREEFYDRVTKVVGTDNAERLFGERELGSSAGVRRHQVSVSKRTSVKNGVGRIVRLEYTEIGGRRYNAHQTGISITDLSEEFQAAIVRDLAALEE